MKKGREKKRNNLKRIFILGEEKFSQAEEKFMPRRRLPNIKDEMNDGGEEETALP